MIEIGCKARLKVVAPEGVITDTRYNKELKCLEHCLEWVDTEGITQHRWFKEAELEEVRA